MPNRPKLLVVCLLLIASCVVKSDNPAENCGRLLSGPRHGDTIYVLCPSLPELSPEQARGVVKTVLDKTTRLAGETRIFFFRDESVLHQDRWPANQERLIESWGDAFVGSYHTHSSLLTVRSTANDEWRNIHLPME